MPFSPVVACVILWCSVVLMPMAVSLVCRALSTWDGVFPLILGEYFRASVLVVG